MHKKSHDLLLSGQITAYSYRLPSGSYASFRLNHLDRKIPFNPPPTSDYFRGRRHLELFKNPHKARERKSDKIINESSTSPPKGECRQRPQLEAVFPKCRPQLMRGCDIEAFGGCLMKYYPKAMEFPPSSHRYVRGVALRQCSP